MSNGNSHLVSEASVNSAQVSLEIFEVVLGRHFLTDVV